MSKAKLQMNPNAEQKDSVRSATNDRDIIAQRAFALYLARGCEDGHDVQDWLRAEEELRQAESAQPQKSVVRSKPTRKLNISDLRE